LRGTIKSIGTYEIPVHVHPQLAATVTVEVVDEEGRIRLDAGGGVFDAETVQEAAAAAAEGTQTDADVLTEQALEAVRALEEQEAQPAVAAPAGDDEEPAQG